MSEDDVAARANAAIDLRKQGKFSEAIEEFESLCEEYPDNIRLKSLRADTYSLAGELTRSIGLFREVVALQPELELGGSLSLFHRLWKDSRFEEAFEEMDRFQSVSFSQDFKGIKEEIVEKWGSLEAFLEENPGKGKE